MGEWSDVLLVRPPNWQNRKPRITRMTRDGCSRRESSSVSIREIRGEVFSVTRFEPYCGPRARHAGLRTVNPSGCTGLFRAGRTGMAARAMGGGVVEKLGALLVGLIFAGSVACAHVVGISTAQGSMFGDTLELVIGFAPADAQPQLLKPEDRPQGKWSQAAFDSVKPQLQWLALPVLREVTAGATSLKPARNPRRAAARSTT